MSEKRMRETNRHTLSEHILSWLFSLGLRVVRPHDILKSDRFDGYSTDIGTFMSTPNAAADANRDRKRADP
jgi:hypothetical protein